MDKFVRGVEGELVGWVRSLGPDAVEAPAPLPRFQRAVVDYFEGKRARFPIEIDLSSVPPFYRSVLEACRRIPYGQTASYADLARAVGKPNAARAVGGAMARNPLPLVVPCHRVLRADGSIGGFSSAHGVDEKIRLLRLENAALDRSADGAAVRAATAGAFNRLERLSRKRRATAAVGAP